MKGLVKNENERVVMNVIKVQIIINKNDIKDDYNILGINLEVNTKVVKMEDNIIKVVDYEKVQVKEDLKSEKENHHTEHKNVRDKKEIQEEAKDL